MTATADPVEQLPDASTSPLAATFARFFATKTGADVAGTMAYFSPDLRTYVDATLGWEFDGFDALQAAFAQYMPGWHPPARSYPTRVLSNETSALIHMVDTPELFGGELRILAAVDLVDGRIVRWVDYWDGAPFDGALYARFRTPAERFPTDLADGAVATRAAPELVAVVNALHRALAAGDAGAAAALLHTDVTVHDMALRSHVAGRIEARRYLERVLGTVPYGAGSRLRHVVGGRHGGGFEWTAADGLVGITAVELDDDGLITDVRSVYDSRQLASGRRSALVAAAVAPIEPPGGPGTGSRAATVTGDVVAGLKDVIRRHRVTLDEFRETVAYVGGVVQGGELELLSAVLFESVVDEAANGAAGGTDSNVEGPFYVAGAPMLEAGGVLPMRPGEPGEQLLFRGSVRSTDGLPLASAVVDVWQADDAGRYSQFAPDIPEWNLRGRIRTDADGGFAFRTVVPAAYDIPGLPHTARLLGILGMPPHRPAHVHVKIAAAGHRDLTTQVYFAGDPWLEHDVVGAARPSLVTELRDGVDAATCRTCTFDFRLAPTDRARP